MATATSWAPSPEKPRRSTRRIIRVLERAKKVPRGQLTKSTVHRLLKAHGASKRPVVGPGARRRALTLSRLTRRDDGRLAYRMKRPAPDGSTHLVLTALELTRRLAALVPPPRIHLVHFAGVFAPRAKLRRHVVPRKADATAPGVPETPSTAPAPTPRKPRLEWAALLLRVFAFDVLACPCGGQRQVLAFITEARVVRRILEHLELPSKPLPWASAQAPPQMELVA